MRFPFATRAGVLALALLSSGCHIRRPGEVRPEQIAACGPQRIAYLEGRFEQASPAERELLTYCRDAQASTSLRATQEHLDYIADLQFIGIMLGVISAIATVIAAGAS